MKVLVINSGSSSIKYQLFHMPSEEVLCSGIIDRIGLEDSNIVFKSGRYSVEEVIQIDNHKDGLEKVVELLLDTKRGVLASTDDIKAVGHRVVHGGSTFTNTIEIDTNVKEKIRQLSSLAPLHNPANLQGILVAESIFKSAKQIAVFDTSFHQTIPEKTFKYAIPNRFIKEDNIRLYGFHGTSHKYVSEKAIEFLDMPKSKLISIHLGNGCSITAIKDGKSIDHSLGFGPVTGLVMGTRSGDIDHSLIFYLINSLGYDPKEVDAILQKESGMLGLTGYSDLRDIERLAEGGDTNCQLALDINAYRVKKYIGSYVAALNGIDAVLFTAGIGENSSLMRKLICEEMDTFGIHLDLEKNDARCKELTEIHTKESKVKILVIPTNEELEIAKQSFSLI